MSNTKDIVVETIDWEEVILKLQVFTRSCVEGKGWFRGGKTKTYLSGKEINEYVMGAIEEYLWNPKKYDPAKGLLIDYLNYSIIRRLVSNDLVSKENRTTQDVFSIADNLEEDEDDGGSYLDRTLPFTDAYFDQEIDYNEIMGFIEGAIKGKVIEENIFLAVYSYGMKRREVIAEFSMTEGEYDNGIRRLKTVFAAAAAKYDLKIKSV